MKLNPAAALPPFRFRYHIFEDGGFVARAFITRPKFDRFKVEFWVSDPAVFVASRNPPPGTDPETCVDLWFARILAGVRNTGCAADLSITSPTGNGTETMTNQYELPASK